MKKKKKKKKTISAPIWQTKGEDVGRTFGLGLTAESGLLEGLLLLLNGWTLFGWLAVSTSTSEKHVGDAVSDGRSDGDGTCRGGHLG